MDRLAPRTLRVADDHLQAVLDGREFLLFDISYLTFTFARFAVTSGVVMKTLPGTT